MYSSPVWLCITDNKLKLKPRKSRCVYYMYIYKETAQCVFFYGEYHWNYWIVQKMYLLHGFRYFIEFFNISEKWTERKTFKSNCFRYLKLQLHIHDCFDLDFCNKILHRDFWKRCTHLIRNFIYRVFIVMFDWWVLVHLGMVLYVWIFFIFKLKPIHVL